MKNSSDKHKKYKASYGKNELYWGIGIENELYLEFERNVQVNKKKFCCATSTAFKGFNL